MNSVCKYLFLLMLLSINKTSWAQYTVSSKETDVVTSETIELAGLEANKYGIFTNDFKPGSYQLSVYEVNTNNLSLSKYVEAGKVNTTDAQIPASANKIVVATNGDIFISTAESKGSGAQSQITGAIMKASKNSKALKYIARIGEKEAGRYYFINTALLANDKGGVIWVGTRRQKPSATKVPEVANDMLAVSFNANGQKLWEKTYNKGRYDEASSAILTKDGAFIMAGIINNKRGLVKMSFDGTVLWTYEPGNGGNIKKISEFENGDLLIVGEGGSGSSRKNTNLYLERLTAKGKLLWTNPYDNPNKTSDTYADALLLANGKIAILAYSVASRAKVMNLVKFDGKGHQEFSQELLSLKKIPKTNSGINNLSYLVEIGNKIAVFSAVTNKEQKGTFVATIGEAGKVDYEHIIPTKGKGEMHPVATIPLEDGSFILVVRKSSSMRYKNKLDIYKFSLKT